MVPLAGVARDPRPEREPGSDPARELVEGFRTVARDEELRELTAVVSVLAIVDGAVDVLVVVAALGFLGLGEAGAGHLSAVWGVGCIAGGSAVLRLLGRGRLSGGLTLGSAIVPAVTLLRRSRLDDFEAGAPVSGRDYALLRAHPVFAPLPVATIERLAGALEEHRPPGGSSVVTQAEAEVGDRLRAKVESIPGAEVEPKLASVAVHYRLANREHHAKVTVVVDELLDEYSERLKVTPGKMVYDLQPKIDWHKGKAVLHLLQTLDLHADDVVPLYLGDDITTRTPSGRWPHGASASSSAAPTIRRWRTGPPPPTSSWSPPPRWSYS